MENIEERIDWLHSILRELEAKFGEDEKLWYKELSTSKSNTAQDVWGTYEEIVEQDS